MMFLPKRGIDSPVAGVVESHDSAVDVLDRAQRPANAPITSLAPSIEPENVERLPLVNLPLKGFWDVDANFLQAVDEEELQCSLRPTCVPRLQIYWLALHVWNGTRGSARVDLVRPVFPQDGQQTNFLRMRERGRRAENARRGPMASSGNFVTSARYETLGKACEKCVVLLNAGFCTHVLILGQGEQGGRSCLQEITDWRRRAK